MLVGAKIGDIWGRERAFAVGLAIYAAGSLTTALSPNLAVLLLGWSLVEASGRSSSCPHRGAHRGQYEGKDRALAYGTRGRGGGGRGRGGPTHRWLGDHHVHLATRFRGRGRHRRGHPPAPQRLRPSPKAEPTPHLDVVGAALSAGGLAVDRVRHPPEQRLGWVTPKGA